jgi:TP53 regulating kinase and related kinases
MEQQKIIIRGAEAIISRTGNKIIKQRIPKGYRHPDIDKKLRTRRTRFESKLLSKANKIIPSPKIILTDEITKSLELQYIPGKRLSDYLSKLPNYITICKQIGKYIALLHNAGIIHGDLTTSNMILSNKTQSSKKYPSLESNKVYFIDFGLGFHSDRVEDKAVDLHLIKEAFEARHHTIHEEAFNSVIESYEKHSNNPKEILTRLEKVEKRGRYKAQY